ncbi:hypothetical protein HUN08_13860 [Gordonia sp. X0973]|uniref:GAP1-N2 domain-containing protein n=1 Tax=Gordonia sp. X0973 TaxID=2742602 RepID=UPI000F540DDD|nr:hypothetical protein [Gordonia sp. X0973]QKT08155.1 hypothetical protein HUN08_13860 [Gordonia sp. X0973]
MADLTKHQAARRVTPAPVAADRYAQFTYTSFDEGAPVSAMAAPGGRGHGGGWQVKQVVGTLDPAYLDELVARIVTRFDLEPALPGFPTPEQIATRPARLSYLYTTGPDGTGRAAYWHTVDAGRDATGRPGNVFAHVLADDAPDDPAGFLPVELWRWSGWSSPYGPDEVRAAALPAGGTAPAPNPALSEAATLDFLLDPAADRVSVLRVLLDAVSARLSGDAPGTVVLGVDDHDRAAAWIAAVSRFLTPQGARRFSWSTHDAPDAVLAGAGSALHLVAVPRARLGELAGYPGVVVDEHEEPYLGDSAAAGHRVASGPVPVTALSVLAEAVLADDDVARRILARRDRVAAEIADAAPAARLAPEWPIAVAVLEDPELAEFHPDAAAVVVDDAPDGLGALPWAADLVETTLRRYPPTPDEALARLRRAALRRRATPALARCVLAAACADPAWLDACDLAGVPAVESVPLGPLRDRIAERAGELAGAGEEATRPLLRTAEIVERLAAPDADLTAARAALTQACTSSGLLGIGDPGWIERFDAAAISEPTLAAHVRPLFARLAVPSLVGLPGDVAGWLFGALGPFGYVHPTPATPDDDYLFGFATRAVLADPASSANRLDPSARGALAGAAIDAALGAARLEDDDCRDLVGAIVALATPPPEDLLRFSADSGRVPPQLLDSMVFYGEVEDAALQAVVDARDSATPELVAAAWLRRGARTATTDRDGWCASVATLATSSASTPAPDGTVAWVGQAADELVVMAAAGFVLGQSDGAPWADPESAFCASLRGRMTSLDQRVRDELARAEWAWLLDPAWVAGHAFTAFLRIAGAGAGPLADDRAGAVGWSQSLVDQRVEAGTYRGPADVAGLRDAGWLVVRGLGPAAAEKFFADYRPAAAEWLARTGIAANSGLGGLG